MCFTFAQCREPEKAENDLLYLFIKSIIFLKILLRSILLSHEPMP